MTQIPEFITVHHSGEDWQKDRDPKEFLINLQSWSRSDRNWIDIPYHYVIDFDGNIYAARDYNFPGDTNTDYDTEGHILTCLIGNYENIKPNDKQIEALINVLTWQCQKFGIKPETLRGHKDYIETACPGKNLYPYISNGYLLKEINTRLGNVVLEK
ncbi:MAG: N-acetylmuramoyl-L-alanine amidase [bacterium]|nr:N-acetylmuramoyl-L-alanine amidase [bacterium]